MLQQEIPMKWVAVILSAVAACMIFAFWYVVPPSAHDGPQVSIATATATATAPAPVISTVIPNAGVTPVTPIVTPEAEKLIAENADILKTDRAARRAMMLDPAYVPCANGQIWVFFHYRRIGHPNAGAPEGWMDKCTVKYTAPMLATATIPVEEGVYRWTVTLYEESKGVWGDWKVNSFHESDRRLAVAH